MYKARRTLLVEDEALVAMLTADILVRCGFQVSAAYSGAEALGVIRRLRRFDLAVLDLGLPDMDGRRIIRTLRKRQPGLPIIVATGYSGPDIAKLPVEWQRLIVLEKPWSEKEFGAALRHLGLYAGPRGPVSA